MSKERELELDALVRRLETYATVLMVQPGKSGEFDLVRDAQGAIIGLRRELTEMNADGAGWKPRAEEAEGKEVPWPGEAKPGDLMVLVANGYVGVKKAGSDEPWQVTKAGPWEVADG